MFNFKGAARDIIFTMLIISALLCGMIWGRLSERRASNEPIMNFVGKIASVPTNKIGYTLSLIENEYVDNVVLDSLADDVIPKILEELDPHSSYIAASEMQRVNEPLDGEFEGVGIVFNMATDTVIVLNVIPAGPSAKAGVNNRDRIIMIDDSLVAGQNVPQNQIVKMLRGARGTNVKLSLERQGIDDLVDVEVTRDVIPLKSIGAAFMVNDTVGYMRMSQFARTTHTELLEGVSKLRKQGMTRLMLDLRDNSGGFLDQAIHIANEFLPKGTLIVYTEDRSGNQIKEFSDGRGTLQDISLQILINENSASSSEILAGAIQDNDRGTIIGRRSYGKGLVQRQIPYSDGSAIRLTVARYYTPTGRSIQKPYTMGDGESYAEDLAARIEHKELFTADSIHFVDSLKKITPGGRVVYGGGGIMPDIFVPIDTTDVTKYFVEVSGRNILYRYTIDYSDRNRDKLAKIETLEQLAAHWDSEKNILNDFVKYATANGIKANWSEINRSRKIIESQIRAYVSRNTALEDNGFYINIFPVDNIVGRALEDRGGEE
ncbi:MAG: S41 family peptidase [Rikenellaceae bacterium]